MISKSNSISHSSSTSELSLYKVSAGVTKSVLLAFMCSDTKKFEVSTKCILRWQVFIATFSSQPIGFGNVVRHLVWLLQTWSSFSQLIQPRNGTFLYFRWRYIWVISISDICWTAWGRLIWVLHICYAIEWD